MVDQLLLRRKSAQIMGWWLVKEMRMMNLTEAGLKLLIWENPMPRNNRTRDLSINLKTMVIMKILKRLRMPNLKNHLRTRGKQRPASKSTHKW